MFKTTVFPFLLAAAIFCFTYATMDHYFDQTIGRIVLSGKAPVGTKVLVTTQSHTGGSHAETIFFGKQPYKDVKRIGTSHLNSPASELTLEISVPANQIRANNNVINLYSIELGLPYASSVMVTKNQLSQYFFSEQFFGDNLDFIRADQQTGKATLKLQKPLPETSIAWRVFPALFVAFLTWLFFRSAEISKLPAFQDMTLGRHISSDFEFNTINGIRGLAALLVLFSHAAPGFKAINVGISILFVISGFLLSKPFVLDRTRIFQWAKVETYFTKRVRRILPMYFLFVFISHVLTHDFDTALRNFLFVEATGHLWPMTQILVFYFCLPIVLMGTSVLQLINRWLPILALSAAAILWYQFMMDWKPFFNGRFFKEFYLYAFLMGVAGSYLQFDILKNLKLERGLSILLSLFLIVLVTLTIAWSAPIPPPAWAFPIIYPFWGKCVLSIAIIVLACNINTPQTRLMLANPLFRSVGIIGFSFYLLHGIGTELAGALEQHIFGIAATATKSWTQVGLAFAITYVMSIFTYSYIERPFFGRRPN